LLRCAVAVLAGELGMAQAAAASTSAADPSIDEIDYEDERTLRDLSTALGQTLRTMSPLERSSAICELATDQEVENRLLAALCTRVEPQLVGAKWCHEALAEDESYIVRNACRKHS
jgi:hypothetical protein